MPAAFDQLTLFSFGGIKFPVERVDMIGAIRDHVHEYSHQDGGDPERMGRKLYVIRVTANFKSGRYPRYQGLWPSSLNTLVTKFEKGEVDDLVIPWKGTISAYAFGWTRSMSARIRSGEELQIEFREDATNLPTPIAEAAPAPTSVAAQSASLAAAIKAGSGIPQPDLDLFDALQSLVNGLVAIKDTSEMAGNLVAAKIAQATSMCADLDGLLSMQDPSQTAIVQSLHALWAQLVTFSDDLQGKDVSMQKFTTPATMSIAGVSTSIYGDASHVEDLLALNSGAFADPSRIPGGTTLVYYPAD